MKFTISKIQFVIVLLLSLNISSCKKTNENILEKGVSLELAKLRDQQIKNIRYQLSFQVPDSKDQNIEGNEIIEVDFNKDLREPLIIDFRNPESFIKSVKINKEEIKFRFENEHIIIPYRKLKDGENQIEINFIAGNRALNRNKEYLYTLFVPDRACTAFPCFDQPSLKARFKNTIIVPKDWIAVSNTKEIECRSINQQKTSYVFDESEPISTYLFSFVAGKFESITKNYHGRDITMYHRENDPEKLNNNTDKIFDLHYSSINWLEEYTKIDYPFQKFDFVVIPSFQYSGMEHPGAILYRDSKLFLDKNPTIREELDRANLIAHETSHIWFGDLVTMPWFSEVWLKEVFANFMAGKIVNPQYPEINHDLNFLINHYPPSYAIDRTKGANPIEQELSNMKNAGTLYGNIIYHKAPIVMNHLEKTTGEKNLKEGLQEYLSTYIFGNASWDNLIAILDKKVTIDLETWNKSWIYEAGMPHYDIQCALDVNNQLQSVIIEQLDPHNKGRQWSQKIDILLADKNVFKTYELNLADTFNVLILNDHKVDPQFIFPNSNGLGYGYFKIDSSSLKNILSNLNSLKDPVLRCSVYISLWENMLNENIEPIDLFNTMITGLKNEENPQNINLALAYLETLFWKFLTNQEQDSKSVKFEEFLWNKIHSENSASIQKAYLKSFYKTVTTTNGINNLYSIWNKEHRIKNLKLSEKDYSAIALELAVRNFEKTIEIINDQKNRIEDEEKKTEFEFTCQSILNRDAFFESLKNEKNREKEPWVVEALYYLHHPLKQEESQKYIRPSLEILEELQITGDIFFPKRWLDATFYGHSSIDAVMNINLFLNEHPNFPENLKNKVLQSTDLVFRASIIKGE